MATPFRFYFTQLILVLTFSFVTPMIHAANLNDPAMGIQFFTGSWKAVLAEAQKQGKPIFIDVYTSWCGPCKMMAKEAFPDKAVGELFNANFVSYQIDAEKGEGIDVAKKYGVKACPTSLYVSADGEVIYRTEGYSGIEGLIDEANKALTTTRDTKPIAVWDKAFTDGQRDVAFLQAYLTKRAKLGIPNPDALTAYLTLIPEADWLTAPNLYAISGNLTTTQSSAYTVLYDHMMKTRLTDKEAYRTIMGGIRSATRNDYKQAVANRDSGQLERLVANERRVLTALLLGDPSKELEKFAGLGFRLRFYQEIGQWEAYKKLALVKGGQLMAMSLDSIRASDQAAYEQQTKRIADMPDSDPRKEQSKEYAESLKTAGITELTTSLNGLARTYANNFINPADLRQALSWSDRALAIHRSPVFLDTQAHLLSKLGRKDEAIALEEEAIQTLKQAHQHTEAYEQALAQLKQ